MFQFSLSFSRGAAQALNFNCALILLPVCRNLISLLRRCFGFNHEVRNYLCLVNGFGDAHFLNFSPSNVSDQKQFVDSWTEIFSSTKLLPTLYASGQVNYSILFPCKKVTV